MEDEAIRFKYEPGPLQQKSFDFAVRTVAAFQHLKKKGVEASLLRQLLRSGTSIGANVEEALGAISKKEFVAKVQISYKEARETDYWIRLLIKSGYIPEKVGTSLLEDVRELRRLLGAAIRNNK